MSDQTWKKKLIEVALPLDAINAEAAREKSIRHGHPSTLHLWWARRPLAACRAVLFAQLIDDPSAHPERFPTEEAQDEERRRLFRIVEDLVKWENSTSERVLEVARAEIRRACGGNPPPIVDPFAGGGSIPLEAQRLGLEAYASDLNPVAVLINKALIEIPPRWANHPPVHPEAANRTHWKGAEGLAEDVRRYGRWMRREAERRIGYLYPKATLPDGSCADIIAWIWARTTQCSNPACQATMPLVRSFWLGRKRGKEAWVKPRIEGRGVSFEIGTGSLGPEPEGTVSRQGATCLSCGTVVSLDEVRDHARTQGLGSQLMAIVVAGKGKRVYLAPKAEQTGPICELMSPDGAPDQVVPSPSHDVDRLPMYGMPRWSDAFTDRQLKVMMTLSDLVIETSERVARDAVALGSEAAAAYSAAIATYLSCALSKVADYGNSVSTWASHPKQEAVRNAFARQAISMSWDFAESAPLGNAAGSLGEAFEWVAKVLDRVRPAASGSARLEDARHVSEIGVIATDPPYYDNVGYADLSDFFYIWLRRGLARYYPSLFSTLVTPKSDELIASSYRHGGSRKAAEAYFERGIVDVFSACRRVAINGYPMTLFYAFKQAEQVADKGLASTGWSTMLEGLAAAGWMVTATWPMRTEMINRTIASGTNALASSVLLSCRPRPDSAGVTDRQGLIRCLRQELPEPLRELQKAMIAPVDLRQAAIGPGMAVFSRFARVVEADGSSMTVRTALGLINQILGMVLDEQEGEFDSETRWAIQWFSQFFFDEGRYGVAEQLAVSMNVSVKGLETFGILKSRGGKVRLLGRDELPDDWDPTNDRRPTVWEATQHLVKRLNEGNEAAAGQLLRRLGGLSDSARLLAYRLYTVCERPRPTLAGPYNALVASWPEIQRHAQQATDRMAVNEQQSFDA